MALAILILVLGFLLLGPLGLVVAGIGMLVYKEIAGKKTRVSK